MVLIIFLFFCSLCFKDTVLSHVCIVLNFSLKEKKAIWNLIYTLIFLFLFHPLHLPAQENTKQYYWFANFWNKRDHFWSIKIYTTHLHKDLQIIQNVEASVLQEVATRCCQVWQPLVQWGVVHQQLFNQACHVPTLQCWLQDGFHKHLCGTALPNKEILLFQITQVLVIRWILQTQMWNNAARQGNILYALNKCWL